MLAHGICYLYLQAFAIPGSVFANLLGGAMFGLPLAFPLCQVLNTLGAIILLFISRRLGKRVVIRFFAERARKLEKQVRSIDLRPLPPLCCAHSPLNRNHPKPSPSHSRTGSATHRSQRRPDRSKAGKASWSQE